VAVHVARQVTGVSLQEIGLQFGERRHTTILPSIKKIEEKRESEEALNLTIAGFMNAPGPKAPRR
jgi:chromosomal replication initiation ATPase DnaA